MGVCAKSTVISETEIMLCEFDKHLKGPLNDQLVSYQLMYTMFLKQTVLVY